MRAPCAHRTADDSTRRLGLCQEVKTPGRTPATESKDLKHLLPTIFYQIPMHGANLAQECIRFATWTRW